MKFLNELRFLVSRNKIRRPDTFERTTPDNNPQNRYADFYEGLMEQRFSSDEDAARYLGYENAQNRSYRRMKNEMKERMRKNMLYLDLDNSDMNERERIYCELWKNIALMNILYMRSAFVNAIELAEVSLNLALRYEFHNQAYLISNFLKLKTNITFFGKSEQNYYVNLDRKLEQIIQAEKIAEELIFHFECSQSNKRNRNEEINQHGQAALNAIKPLLEKHKTFRISLFFYLIQINTLLGSHQYEAALRASEEAIDYLQHLPYPADHAFSIFNKLKLICIVQLKRYEDIPQVATSSIAAFSEGSYSWVTGIEFYIQALFHAERFEEAWTWFLTVVNHPQFVNHSIHIKEIWRIIEAYFAWLYRIGKISPTVPRAERLLTFRLNRFLNDVPFYTKDKRGRYIPILVVRFLLAVTGDQAEDHLPDQAEALQKLYNRLYRDRYTSRTRLFLKLLSLFFQHHGNPARLEKTTRPVQEELELLKENAFGQDCDTEMIPYPNLWRYLLDYWSTHRTHHLKR